MAEHLYFYEPGDLSSQWHYDYKGMRWPGIFDPFTAVKHLYLSKEFVTHIAPVLRGLGKKGVTDALPALQNIYLEGFRSSEPIQQSIARFVAARQLAGHPINVSLWERDPEWSGVQRFDSY